MGAYITSFGTSLPEYRVSQKKLARFMSTNLELDGTKKKEMEVLFRASGIDTRYTVLKDYSTEKGDFIFFPNTKGLEPFPSVSSRMKVFRKEALKLSLDASRKCIGSSSIDSISHLITVSCTGMYAPGLDFDLVKYLGLSHSVKRTSINFMGCYAAFNALKLANDICKANKGAKVLIASVELCSIHFQKDADLDTMLANALFGDGAASMIVEGEATNSINLKIENFHCDLMIEGEQEMTWGIGDHGFEMTLSTYVPDLIKKGVKSLIDNLLTSLELSTSQIQHFAIHPGGKKILEVIEAELNISKEDNKHAYQVMKNYGNMSSPTILFVLERIFLELEEKDKNSNILGLAFGPGLTLESMILKVS
jgi:alpha-pyrone synthase